MKNIFIVILFIWIIALVHNLNKIEQKIESMQTQLNKIDLMSSNIYSQKNNQSIIANIKKRKPINQKTKNLEEAIIWLQNSRGSN